VQLIGPLAAEQLRSSLSGAVIRVPSNLRQRLRAQVSGELDCRCADPQHHSYRTIAVRNGLSRRTVARVAKLPAKLRW
jgi:hypothetical protein